MSIRSVGRPSAPRDPLLWMVQGMSGDGKRVILGKYTTRDQAQSELDKLALAKYYRQLALVELPPPETPPA